MYSRGVLSALKATQQRNKRGSGEGKMWPEYNPEIPGSKPEDSVNSEIPELD